MKMDKQISQMISTRKESKSWVETGGGWRRDGNVTLDASTRISNIYAFISVSDKLKIRSRLGTIFLYF